MRNKLKACFKIAFEVSVIIDLVPVRLTIKKNSERKDAVREEVSEDRPWKLFIELRFRCSQMRCA